MMNSVNCDPPRGSTAPPPACHRLQRATENEKGGSRTSGRTPVALAGRVNPLPMGQQFLGGIPPPPQQKLPIHWEIKEKIRKTLLVEGV